MVSSYAPTSRVSVLHLLTPAEVGGKEAVVPALVLGARGSKVEARVAVSRTLVDDLAASGVPRERLHYVQNAWYPSEPPLDRGAACRALGLGVAPNGFRVGWVGRLSAEKGPDVLVEALRQLEDLPVTVSFVGAGPLRQALETRAASVDVVDRIRWHGLVPRAGRLLRAFEAFVLTSRSEGTPIALFEADRKSVV